MITPSVPTYPDFHWWVLVSLDLPTSRVIVVAAVATTSRAVSYALSRFCLMPLVVADWKKWFVVLDDIPTWTLNVVAVTS